MSDHLGAARLIVARDRPYYSTCLWALQPVPTSGLLLTGGALAVDRHLRLYYDPDVIATWPIEELVGAVIHEVNHVLGVHAQRRGERHEFLWNVACDLAINSLLRDEKVTLPPDVIYPHHVNLPVGLSADEYYDRLLAQMPPPPGGVGAGRCGSIAHGVSQDYEQSSEGSATVPPGLSTPELDVIRKRVAEDVIAHKARGKVPGWLQRWAEGLLTPVVDWRRKLAAYVRHQIGAAKGAADYTYRRPSRRSTVDVLFPSMVRPTPSVAVVVDTSGSMGQHELNRALAEIRGILVACGQQAVAVLACDAAVHATTRVFKASDVKLIGGGGTDMRVGIDAAVALVPRPHLIVVVTDGYTPWPAHAPGIPVVVVLTTAHGTTPSWARTIVVPEAA
jgi:predicted metal-dependent peptidase